ncbi:MAG: hypothetical protein HS103_00545 [Anaerolineales bacterium]|nr:hypothetical protein [Anaerolineales bacterium]
MAAGEWNTPIERGARGEFGDLTDAFNGMAGDHRQQKLNRQMVGDIAHDLRTPLSVMMLEIEAIEAGYQTPTEAAAAPARKSVG